MLINGTSGPDIKDTPGLALEDLRCSTRVEELDLLVDDQVDWSSDKKQEWDAPVVQAQNLGTKRAYIPKAKKVQTSTVAQ